MKKKELLQLRLDGMTYAGIGKLANISRQRVQQILCPPASIRDFVVKKYNGRCKHCGIRVGSSGHVHHKDDDEDAYNDIHNLELLCLGCHRIEHSRRLGRTRITTEMEDRNKLILFYHNQGYSAIKISKLVNLSRIHIYNILNFMKGQAVNLK